MAKITRYSMQAGLNFTDFSLHYPDIDLSGHQITFKGELS